MTVDKNRLSKTLLVEQNPSSTVQNMENIHVRIDPESDLTVYRVIGQVTGDDVSRIIKEFYDNHITRNVLWDLSESDVSKLSADDVFRVAHTPRKRAEMRIGGKTAIVAPTDITFGLTRMYEFMTEVQSFSFTTQTFRTTQEAYQWLFEESEP